MLPEVERNRTGPVAPLTMMSPEETSTSAVATPVKPMSPEFSLPRTVTPTGAVISYDTEQSCPQSVSTESTLPVSR
jgi:hypothetical protein